MQPFDIKNFSEKDIKEIIEFLENETIKVAVFGEFGTGKSTFINAILNEKILAKDYVPTTAVPTIISYSNLFNISVKMKSIAVLEEKYNQLDNNISAEFNL